ncbi:MAG: TonB-dependent receptor [Acidobacteria bacterium]|nr:TonB-dependent receptor [Acidobacteriota bacterium]
MRLAARIFFAIVLFTSSLLLGQSSAARLSGRVADSAGGMVPNVILEARQQESGMVYRATSDAEGFYEFLRLPPGHYDLTATYQGFKPFQHRSLILSAGESIALDLSLEIRESEQSITVVGEPAPLDLSSPNLSHIINETSFNTLPVNGRSLEQLALLVPGMVPVRALDRRSVNGFTTKLSSNGARGDANLFLLDGTDIHQAVLGTTPGGVSGLLLGMESVQEFEILNDAYPAYLGRAGGAVVNVITRRGTPEIHGSLFEYYRDSALDARNFFDGEIPPFSRHQFGGSVGGPLLGKGHTIFASFEALRERLGLTLFNTVPTLEARRGVLPFRTVRVAREVQPILDLYPLPNGQDFEDGSAAYSYQTVQPTDDYHVSVRTDFSLSPNDTLFARYTLQDSTKKTPLDTSIQGFNSDLKARNQYVTIEQSHIFSSRLLHTLQFAFNRSYYRSVSETDPRLQTVPPLIANRPNFGRINIRGLSSFGTDTADLNFPMNQWEVHNALHWSANTHEVRVGFGWKRYQSNGFYNAFFDGLLIYENLQSFLTNGPQRFQGADAGADSHKNYRQHLFNLYVQDQYRVRPDLTLSGGLRYEWFAVPTEKSNRISNLRNLMDAAPVVGDPLFKNPSLLNFAPRAGLAWDIGGRNRTVLRSGFGIFYEPILENIYGYNARIQPPFAVVRTTIRPPYPNPLDARVKGRPRLDPVEFEPSTPYAMRYHVTLQQLLPADLVLSVGYSGARGVHLPRVGDLNSAAPISVEPNGTLYFGPTPGSRRNPEFDLIRFTSTDANSVYNSLQLGLQRRWKSGLQLQFAYTYGRSIDDASGYRREFTNSIADVPPSYYSRGLERGLSNFNIQHHAVFHYTWDLPFRITGNRLLAALLNDWQTAGIVAVSSGFPFTANVSFDIANNLVREGHRPNLRPGASNNPVLGGPDRYFDTSAFQLQTPGYLGTLGRNTLVGPGFVSVDLALSRNIHISESQKISVRVEAFNLLNRSNFAPPQNSGTGGVIVFNSTDGLPVGNAGKIFSTVGSSRQLQLGLRWAF